MINLDESPVLRQAYAVQDFARNIMMKRDQGVEPDGETLALWMLERRNLAGAEITTSLDALAVSHQLLQCISALHRFSEDADALGYMASETAIAVGGLIRFLEGCSGVTREALGLHDDYCGPTRN